MATEPAAIEEQAQPAAEPEVTDVPAVAEPDVQPDGQAEQEAAAEPTSDVATAPPAFDLYDPDIAFIVDKYGSDPNVVARELHALNNRMAEMSRQPEPATPREEPKSAQPTSVDIPADVEQEVWRSVWTDPECVALKEDYNEARAQIAEVAQFNRRGELTGGEVFQVDQQASKLLSDISAIKALIGGQGLVKLDEFQVTEAKNALADKKEQYADLKERREGLVKKYETMLAQKKRYSDAYQKRFDGFRDHFSKRVQTERASREEQRIIQGLANDFTKEWNSAMDAAFKSLKIPNDPELRQALKDAAVDKGKLAVNPNDPNSKVIPTGGSQAFIENVFRREMKTGDYWKRQGAGTYAGQKRADVKPQAPGGRAAVAPADPANSTDWKERWKARALSVKEQFEKDTGLPTV